MRNCLHFINNHHIIIRKPPPRLKPSGETILQARHILDRCESGEAAQDVARAVLASSNFIGVDTNDIRQFTNLEYFDLGDNKIPMCQLANLPALAELHMPCNGIYAVQINNGTDMTHIDVDINIQAYLSPFESSGLGTTRLLWNPYLNWKKYLI
jgi:hypothetical protein